MWLSERTPVFHGAAQTGLCIQSGLVVALSLGAWIAAAHHFVGWLKDVKPLSLSLSL